MNGTAESPEVREKALASQETNLEEGPQHLTHALSPPQDQGPWLSLSSEHVNSHAPRLKKIIQSTLQRSTKRICCVAVLKQVTQRRRFKLRR